MQPERIEDASLRVAVERLGLVGIWLWRGERHLVESWFDGGGVARCFRSATAARRRRAIARTVAVVARAERGDESNGNGKRSEVVT